MRRAPYVFAMVLAVAITGLTVWRVTVHDAWLASKTMAADQIGGPFDLIATDGSRTTNEDFLGKPFAIFFGYTNCPDVCPTSLIDMSDTIAALGDRADEMRYAFVSVDPKRDTPEYLGDYLSSFDTRIIGLTGSAEAIADVAKAYRVYYEEVPSSSGDYSVNHTATTYLMGADGRLRATVSYQEDPTKRLAKFQRVLDGG